MTDGIEIETQLLINNKLVPASDNGTFELYSPHTGDIVAKGGLRPINLLQRTKELTRHLQWQKQPSMM